MGGTIRGLGRDAGRWAPYRRKAGRRASPARGTGCTLAIGDLHTPFQHPEAWDFISRVHERLGAPGVVLQGDEADFHAFSRWPVDPDGLGPGLELDAAVRELRGLFEIIPRARVCVSNHTIRPWRKAALSGLPVKVLRSYREALDAPKGWEWSEAWCVDGVWYEHGDAYGANAARSAMAHNLASTVVGHEHARGGDLTWLRMREHAIWGFNAGCLIDARAYAMAYARTPTARNLPGLGVGIVERGVPRFVPMRLRSNGLWDRKLGGV